MKLIIQKTSILNKLVIGVGFTLILLIGSILFSYTTSRQLYGNFNLVQHTYKVTYNLESILLHLTENEAAARGYIITGNENFVHQVADGAKNMSYEITVLDSLLSFYPIQEIRLKSFKSLIQHRMDIINLTINLKRGGENDERLLIAKVEEGKIYRDNLRNLKDVMEKEEEFFLLSRQKEANINLKNTNVTLGFAAFISCIVATFVYFIVKRDIEQKNNLEKDLYALNLNKNKFFSIISHDLRNPIYGIVKLAGFLKDEKNTTRQDALVMGGIIEKSALKVSILLENLLKWAEVQMDTLKINSENFNIHLLANECIDSILSTAQLKKINIENAIEKSAVIHADRNMIDTVLRNIISNSIKFTNERGNIVLSSKTTESKIAINIKDNGVGMDESTIEKLFKVNHAYSSYGTADEAGSGLGLILCKEFIEANHGEISVTSLIGVGSNFKIAFPIPQIISSTTIE